MQTIHYLPIDNLLARFQGCKYFSTIDLRSGYYRIRLSKEAVEKTTFIIDKGKWVFHFLPFGINIGPSAFSYVLGKVLSSCQEFTINYLDDIIVFSQTWQEHLLHLEEVFKRLEIEDLKIKCSKCKFFKTKVHYLGYLVGSNGIQPLPEKVEAIKKPIAPTNIDELRQFLDLVGFYRKFVLFFADITSCLTKMLRKGVPFVWTAQCNSAFETLKEEV